MRPVEHNSDTQEETIANNENIEYEPEQFSGLVYRLDEPSVVALLCGSGKLVITGGKQIWNADQALSVIEDRLTDRGLLE